MSFEQKRQEAQGLFKFARRVLTPKEEEVIEAPVEPVDIRSGIAQLGHLSEHPAFEAARERAKWIDLRLIKRLGAMLEHLHQAGFVRLALGQR